MTTPYRRLHLEEAEADEVQEVMDDFVQKGRLSVAEVNEAIRKIQEKNNLNKHVFTTDEAPTEMDFENEEVILERMAQLQRALRINQLMRIKGTFIVGGGILAMMACINLGVEKAMSTYDKFGMDTAEERVKIRTNAANYQEMLKDRAENQKNMAIVMSLRSLSIKHGSRIPASDGVGVGKPVFLELNTEVFSELDVISYVATGEQNQLLADDEGFVYEGDINWHADRKAFLVKFYDNILKVRTASSWVPDREQLNRAYDVVLNLRNKKDLSRDGKEVKQMRAFLYQHMLKKFKDIHDPLTSEQWERLESELADAKHGFQKGECSCD